MGELADLSTKIANEEIKKSNTKTSHVIHLVLTLLTGFWVIIWVICAVSNNNTRSECDKRVSRLRAEREIIRDELRVGNLR